MGPRPGLYVLQTGYIFRFVRHSNPERARKLVTIPTALPRCLESDRYFLYMIEGKLNRCGVLHFLRCEIYRFKKTPVNSYQSARHHKAAHCVSWQYENLKSTERDTVADWLTEFFRPLIRKNTENTSVELHQWIHFQGMANIRAWLDSGTQRTGFTYEFLPSKCHRFWLYTHTRNFTDTH